MSAAGLILRSGTRDTRGGREVRAPREPAEHVSVATVMGWLCALCRGVSARHAEIGSAITDAANRDPLFEGKRGPLYTAAYLLALAWSQSGLNPGLVGKGGKAFGLYQIELPREQVANNCLLASTASFIAIEMLRQQFEAPACSLAEKLAWYGEPAPRVVTRIHLTQALIARAA